VRRHDPPTATWPRDYLVSYRPGRNMALQVSTLLMLRTVAGSWTYFLRSVGIVAGAFAAGLLLSALDRFQEGWQVYLVFFVIPLVVGVIGAVIVNRARTNEWFKPGSQSEFRIHGGRLLVTQNGHAFGGALDEVQKIRTFGSASMLIFDDDKVIVVPTRVLPRVNEQN
jgi:MFS family permease